MDHQLVSKYFQKFENEIVQYLKENLSETVQCKAKCGNGKQCTHNAHFGSFCKKHKNSVSNTQRIIPNLTYHNHLPGQTIYNNCPACQIVGINS